MKPDVTVRVWSMEEGLVKSLKANVQLPEKRKVFTIPLKRATTLDEIKPAMEAAKTFLAAAEVASETLILSPSEGFSMKVENEDAPHPSAAPSPFPKHVIPSPPNHPTPSLARQTLVSPMSDFYASNKPLRFPREALKNAPPYIRSEPPLLTRADLEAVIVNVPRVDAIPQNKLIEMCSNVSEPKVALSVAVLEWLGKIEVNRVSEKRHFIRRIDPQPSSLTSISEEDVDFIIAQAGK